MALREELLRFSSQKEFMAELCLWSYGHSQTSWNSDSPFGDSI
jgi:hypothetical protein